MIYLLPSSLSAKLVPNRYRYRVPVRECFTNCSGIQFGCCDPMAVFASVTSVYVIQEDAAMSPGFRVIYAIKFYHQHGFSLFHLFITAAVSRR
jgi:NhaP-type Na+/H+ and K+/H+ antiporter